MTVHAFDVRPALARIGTAAELLGLPARTLLHAGPPLADPSRPPAVLRASAAVTARHQGWAATPVPGEAVVAECGLHLEPAQSRGCVVPLAALVSCDTPLVEVVDLAGIAPRAWAPIGAVGGIDTRMGVDAPATTPAMLARLERRDRFVAPRIAACLSAPLPLWPIAAAGMADGDDLHSRTTGATRALAAALAARTPHDPAWCDEIAATPLFFLTIWMAACRQMLAALERGPRPTLVTRLGGNGEAVGLALAGDPATWHVAPASAPAGPRLPGTDPSLAVSPAVGDSLVIELMGFGGQRLAAAPEPLSVLGPFAPDDHAQRPSRLCALEAGPDLVRHVPALAGLPLGVDAARVVAEGRTPLACLAMIEAGGTTGLLGRGLWQPPLAPFAQALAAAAIRAPRGRP